MTHREDDCPVGDLVRAYAELHRQAHIGTVAECTRQPCIQLVASLLPGQTPAIPGPAQGQDPADTLLTHARVSGTCQN